GALSFADSRWGKLPDVRLVCNELILHGADFSDGGRLQVRSAEIDLRRARFGAPMTLSIRTRPKIAEEPQHLADLDPQGLADFTSIPRLATLDDADLTNLSIDGID